MLPLLLLMLLRLQGQRAHENLEALKQHLECVDLDSSIASDATPLDSRWASIVESVTEGATELAEQLRIIIEPTIATKMQCAFIFRPGTRTQSQAYCLQRRLSNGQAAKYAPTHRVHCKQLSQRSHLDASNARLRAQLSNLHCNRRLGKYAA